MNGIKAELRTRTTAYVPQRAGHRECSIVLASVDCAANNARTALVAAIAEGNSDAITDAWTHYDQIAVDADTVYRCLGAVNDGVHDDLSQAARTISEYLSQILNAKEHALTVSFTVLGDCEQTLVTLNSPARCRPDVFVESARFVCNAMADVMREVRTHSAEFVRPLLTSERLAASGWREHGFKTNLMFDNHRRGEMPASMMTYLTETLGHPWSARKGSALLQLGWQQLNQTPVGIRTGMAARYSGVEQVNAGLLLFEQLLMASSHSLFHGQLHRRLRTHLYDKPNASVNINSRVPLLAVMYSVRAHQPSAEQDIEHAIDQEKSIDALRITLIRRLDQLDDGWLATRDERNDFAVPHINAFLGMSAAWYLLANQVTVVSPEPAQFAGLSEEQRGLYQMVNCLVAARSNPHLTKLMARLFWWMRYAQRGCADEHEFWRWSVMRTRMLLDLSAFSVSSSIFGNRTWQFAAENVSA